MREVYIFRQLANLREFGDKDSQIHLVASGNYLHVGSVCRGHKYTSTIPYRPIVYYNLSCTLSDLSNELGCSFIKINLNHDSDGDWQYYEDLTYKI